MTWLIPRLCLRNPRFQSVRCAAFYVKRTSIWRTGISWNDELTNS